MRSPALKFGFFLSRRSAPRIMASGHDLRRSVFNQLDISKGEERIERVARNAKPWIMPGNLVRAGEKRTLIDMPAGDSHTIAVAESVHRHHVAIPTKNRFCQTGDGLSHHQVSKRLMVLEHPHQTHSPDVVAFLIVLQGLVIVLSNHPLFQGFNFCPGKHISEVEPAFPIELIDELCCLLLAVGLTLFHHIAAIGFTEYFCRYHISIVLDSA